MRITTILGSPRRAGITAAVLQQFEALAGRQALVERINMIDCQVAGCLGCDTCQEDSGLPGCSQEDDAGWILEKILQSDLVVYASPVYVWSYSAQLKALMDRHYCLVKCGVASNVSLMAGKWMMLLTTCGDSAADAADLIQEEFRREAKFLQARVVGMHVLDKSSLSAGRGERGAAVAGAMLVSAGLSPDSAA